jgi:hypothetical protein
MEINTQEENPGKDSFGFERLTKGYNVKAKVYFMGNGDLNDTVDKMKARLIDYRNFLNENFNSNTFIQ